MPGSITVEPARRCRLRVGTVADAECVAGLALFVFLDTYAADGMRADLAREALAMCSAASFAAALSDPQQQLVLAEFDSLLLGFAQLALQPAAASGDLPSGLELIRLYVHPAHQRCGLGRMLLADAEARPVRRLAWRRGQAIPARSIFIAPRFPRCWRAAVCLRSEHVRESAPYKPGASLTARENGDRMKAAYYERTGLRATCLSSAIARSRAGPGEVRSPAVVRREPVRRQVEGRTSWRPAAVPRTFRTVTELA
jgi:GNAT superfamily N-acetyltransferase